MLSNLRKAVLVQLAKAWRLSLDVPASRLVRVFNLNGLLTYKFLRELEVEGVAERTNRGRWRLRDSGRARALAEYALSEWGSGFYSYFPENVPDIYYYVPDLPTPWFGGVGYVLVIADPVLEGRVDPPTNFKVIYTSFRGREFRFDWNKRLPVGSREQSIADLLSYDPNWAVELYLLWYYGDYDLDGVARRCAPYGLRRLSSFLSFMRVAVGKPLATSFDYVALLDEEVYRRYLSEYFSYVFANGVDMRRNI